MTIVTMPPKIMAALNKFDYALRKAVIKDTIAEQKESSLKTCDAVWQECKAARVELEAVILAAL